MEFDSQFFEEHSATELRSRVTTGEKEHALIISVSPLALKDTFYTGNVEGSEMIQQACTDGRRFSVVSSIGSVCTTQSKSSEYLSFAKQFASILFDKRFLIEALSRVFAEWSSRVVFVYLMVYAVLENNHSKSNALLLTIIGLLNVVCRYVSNKLLSV